MLLKTPSQTQNNEYKDTFLLYIRKTNKKAEIYFHVFIDSLII